MQLGFVIAMVTGIHFVEAYLLNPAIYSAHLKLHPLLVISTLVVAEHSLGVWGLLLAGQYASSFSVACASCVVCCKLCKMCVHGVTTQHSKPCLGLVRHAAMASRWCHVWLCLQGTRLQHDTFW